MPATVCFLSSMHPARDKRVFEKEARALVEGGCHVVHVCPTVAGETEGLEVVDSVRIRRFKKWSGIVGRILGIPRLVGYALRERADVYHCNEVDSWIAGIIASRQRGARVIFDVHEHYPSSFGTVHLPRWLHRPAATAICLLYRVLVPLTHGFVFAKSSVAADFKVAVDRTALVRNLPPLRLLKATSERARHERLRQVVAIHTGYTGRMRGWPHLLDALVRPEAAPLVAVFIGEFNDGSEPEFWKRVASLGLGHRVTMDPWQPFEEAFARLLEADIGLILFQPGIQNHVYASPHKLFEYMMAGLPVVAPRFAVEVADIVNRYACGILVDTSKPAEIAAAMRRLADDPDLRRKMGGRGRKAVLEELNWEREVAELYSLYQRLGLPVRRARCLD